MPVPTGTYKFATTALIFLAALGLAGCRSQHVQSVWLKPTSIAANGPEWWNLASYRVDKLHGTVTIVNDSNAVYLRFYSKDRRLARRVEKQGLTLWLTDAQDKSRKLGIRYPLGYQEGDVPVEAHQFLPTGDVSSNDLANMLRIENDDLTILSRDSSERGRKTRDQAEQLGIHAVYTQTDDGGIEYSMRIAMGRLAPWIQPGEQLALSIESAPFNKKQFWSETLSEEGGYLDRKPTETGKTRGGGLSRKNGFGSQQADQADGIPLYSPIHFLLTIQLATAPKHS
jgi:hypothetical protein